MSKKVYIIKLKPHWKRAGIRLTKKMFKEKKKLLFVSITRIFLFRENFTRMHASENKDKTYSNEFCMLIYKNSLQS